MVEDGHSVTVVTGRPNYNFPDGKVPNEYLTGKHDRECIRGVNIIRCKTRGRGKNKLRLVLNYLDYVRQANKLVKKLPSDYDIVFSYQLTPVMQVKPANKYARKNGKKHICYCLDLAPESGMKMLKHFKLISRFYKNSAKKIYNACDKIAVTSDSFIEYHNRVNGIPLDKLVYIPQHAPTTLLDQDLSKPINEGDKRILLFAGNIGVGAKLDTVVSAASTLVLMGQKNFEVRFVGDGSDKARLMQLVKEKELEKYVCFHDGVPFDKMPDIYRGADALLISLRKGQITIPGKLQAYMSTGKPIFGAMDSAGNAMIKESECGVCVSAEDANALALVLNDFINNPRAYQRHGEKGRLYFENHFTLDRYMKSLMSLINKLVVEEENE